jgi:hypothetical protein
MTQTYLEARTQRFAKARGGVERSARGGTVRKARKALSPLIEALTAEERSCMICERLETAIANYAFTVLTLYRTDPEFAERFRQSEGFCLPHLRTTLEVAPDVLSPADIAAWLTDLFGVHDDAVRRLSEELEEMTKRYDYRATEPVTEKLKESVPRAIEKLVGRFRW